MPDNRCKTTGLDWNNFNGTAGVQMKLAENQDLKNINENPKVTFSINDTSNVQTTITGRVSVDEAGIITITSDNGEIVKFTPVVTDGITEYIVSANGNELYKLGAAHFPEDNTTRVIIGHKNPDGTYTETDVLKDQAEEFNMSEIPCFGEAYQHLDVTQQRAANHQLKAEANASVSIKVFQSGGQEYKTEIEQNGKRYVLDRVIDSAGRVYPDNTVGMGRMGIYIPIDD